MIPRFRLHAAACSLPILGAAAFGLNTVSWLVTGAEAAPCASIVDGLSVLAVKFSAVGLKPDWCGPNR